jgi:hypothetical protein
MFDGSEAILLIICPSDLLHDIDPQSSTAEARTSGLKS